MSKQSTRFGIFADLHVDIMHDTEARLEQFLAACREENVDFIIQLGDFCYPDENRRCVCAPDKRPVNIENALRVPTYADKAAILRLFRDFEKPSYHVLGNHDSDMCSKRDVLDFYGAGTKPYDSFDCGGFHFVVLDCNYYKVNGQYRSFENGNYFDESYHDERILPYCPPEELAWLEKDLAGTTLPSVLFSHQALMERDYGASILNAGEMKKILKNAPGGVVACVHGHEHLDYALQEDGIWFVSINAMSCMWVDAEFAVKGRYGAEIDEKYPNIQYTVPYRDAVYAIVTLDETGCAICGTKSEFVGPTPEEMGFYQSDATDFNRKYRGEQRITPCQQDRFLPFEKG